MFDAAGGEVLAQLAFQMSRSGFHPLGAQENKLRLVGEVADRVWRTGG